VFCSIVFVHGVENDQKSWKTDSVFWPETILPGLIPNARILAFESEGITVDNFWNTEDMITDVAEDLLGELVDMRSGDAVRISGSLPNQRCCFFFCLFLC
jgi:hypothetical protein